MKRVQRETAHAMQLARCVLPSEVYAETVIFRSRKVVFEGATGPYACTRPYERTRLRKLNEFTSPQAGRGQGWVSALEIATPNHLSAIGEGDTPGVHWRDW